MAYTRPISLENLTPGLVFNLEPGQSIQCIDAEKKECHGCGAPKDNYKCKYCGR